MSLVTGPGLSRRAFLRGSVGLAVTLPLAACAAPPPAAGAAVSEAQLETLALAGRTLWPAVEGLAGAEGAGIAQRAARLLALAPNAMQADVRRMLGALDRLAFLGGSLGGLAGLDDAGRRRYLFGWRDAGFSQSDQLWAGLVRLTGTLTYMSPATWPGIGYPGPWHGRLDVGVGLRHERPLAANPNPNWDTPFEARKGAADG